MTDTTQAALEHEEHAHLDLDRLGGARPYQLRIISQCCKHLPELGSALIESATGSGKTYCGLKIAEQMSVADPELQVIWVAMNPGLLRQVRREVEKFGITNLNFHTVSIMNDSQLLDVATKVQGKRKLLVCDEAQHAAATSMVHVYSVLEPDYHLGLSATPFRQDKAQLGYRKIVKDASIHRLISDGWLSKFDLHMIPDWEPANVVEVFNAEPEKWGKSAFYFLRMADARLAYNRLKDYGHRVGLIDNVNNTAKENYKIIEDFHAGNIQQIVNCMVLTEGFDCLSEDTEVLTADGWKDKDQVTTSDLCWSVNPQTGANELVEVQAVAQRPLKDGEEMYALKNQHLDVLVTGGHNIYYKYRDPNKSGDLEQRLSDNFIIRTAVEMSEKNGEWQLPLTGNSVEIGDADISDNDLRLLGWMQTDGYVSRGVAIEISQSEKESKHSEEIRDLLDSLGYSYNESYVEPNDNGFESEYGKYRFYVHAEDIVHLRPWMSKTELGMYWTLSRRQFSILWEAMMLGNGNLQYSQNGNRKSGCCHFGYQEQADNFHRLAITRGFTSYFKTEKTPLGNDCWRVSARDRRWMSLRASDPRSTRFVPVEYSGLVWCVKNQNGTIIVRRNGKTAVIGNCPSLQTVFIRDGSKGPITQMAGRVLRLYDGLPVKNIVQSQKSVYPFSRTTSPHKTYVLRDGQWVTSGSSDKADAAATETIQRMVGIEVKLPDFLVKRMEAQKARRRRGMR